jgi:hypothetical protein
METVGTVGARRSDKYAPAVPAGFGFSPHAYLIAKRAHMPSGEEGIFQFDT